MDRSSIGNINFKISIIGDSATGKTSMLLRYLQDFYNEEYTPTVSASIFNKQVTEKGNIIKLTFFDLSGKEKFDSTRGLYFKNIQAFMIVISIDNQPDKILSNVSNWYSRIQEFLSDDVPVFLVISKCDLLTDELSQLISTIEAWADEYSIISFKVSSKTGHLIKECFEALVKALMKTNRSKVINSLTLDSKSMPSLRSNAKCCN